MLRPMMGFSFALAAFGLVGGIGLLLFPASRAWALFLMLPTIFAGILSCSLSWGLALLLEQILRLGVLAGWGFFGGYLAGGVLGAAGGLLLASRLARRGVA